MIVKMAASGASPGDEDEENLEFLYDDALEKGEDEGAGEGGGRSRGHIGRSPSGSSVTLSLPPSFDDSLDISPFLARVRHDPHFQLIANRNQNGREVMGMVHEEQDKEKVFQ